MAVKKKGADFEQSLNALETLVNKMEQGDMTLEESLKGNASEDLIPQILASNELALEYLCP